MEKYVSFSLWGDEDIYNIGAIRNAELMKEIYPGWKMIVFHDVTVPDSTIEELNKLDVVTKDVTDLDLYGMFWRFLVIDYDDCELAIFRDADSRISKREQDGVLEWISSKKTLHVIRDHPAHKIPYGNDEPGILGGMWGIKGKTLPILDMIKKFHKNNTLQYGSDQTFLKTIYNVYKNDMFLHDEFSGGNKFKLDRVNGSFIGERITEHDKPQYDDHLILINKK